MSLNLHGKRILICEEALSDYKGHFYSWVKAIRKIHLQEGVVVLIACNRGVKQEIKEEFGAIPAFSRNSWSGMYYHKRAWKRYLSVFGHNYFLWREVRTLFRQTGPVDCVLLIAARIHHLLAWRALCQWGLGKDFKRIVIFIVTSEAIYDPSFTSFYFKRSSLLIRGVLQSFRKMVQDRKVIFAGDSHITCQEYTTLSGIPFQVFPSPAAGLEACKTDDVAPAQYEAVTTFVLLGVSVIDKGIDVLQKAILLLLNRAPSLPVRFIIQWAQETIDYEGSRVAIAEGLRQSDRVELITEILDEKEYKSYLHQADFLVLPYRRKVYHNRISGVAVEAAIAGIPMIVTEGTWLQWAVDTFGSGVTFKDGDAEDLANKISMCVINKLKYQQEARQQSIKALKLNSGEKYLESIWK